MKFCGSGISFWLLASTWMCSVWSPSFFWYEMMSWPPPGVWFFVTVALLPMIISKFQSNAFTAHIPSPGCVTCHRHCCHSCSWSAYGVVRWTCATSLRDQWLLETTPGPYKFCTAYITLTFFALISDLHLRCPRLNAVSGDWSTKKLTWLLDLPRQNSRSTILGRHLSVFPTILGKNEDLVQKSNQILAVQLLPNIGIYYYLIVWRVKESLTDLMQSTSPLTTAHRCAAEISFLIMKWLFLRSTSYLAFVCPNI